MVIRRLVSLMVVALTGETSVAQSAPPQFTSPDNLWSVTVAPGFVPVTPEVLAGANTHAQAAAGATPIRFVGGFAKDPGSLAPPYVLVQLIASDLSNVTPAELKQSLELERQHVREVVERVRKSGSDVGMELGSFTFHDDATYVMTSTITAGAERLSQTTLGFPTRQGQLLFHCYDREAAAGATMPVMIAMAESRVIDPSQHWPPRGSGLGFWIAALGAGTAIFAALAVTRMKKRRTA